MQSTPSIPSTQIRRDAQAGPPMHSMPSPSTQARRNMQQESPLPHTPSPSTSARGTNPIPRVPVGVSRVPVGSKESYPPKEQAASYVMGVS